MNEYLAIDTTTLQAKQAYWTAKEIAQQPRVWREAAKNVKAQKSEISTFLAPILALNNLRIILTGAGTSAYIGDAVAPHILKAAGRACVAISTTNIVSNPDCYLLADAPTLLISFARSGNSPESLAAVQLADQIIKNCFHLVITCNVDGELAKGTEGRKNAFSLHMPKGTLDESFAMTSSFTSMLVSVLSVFTPNEKQLEIAATSVEYLLDNELSNVKQHAENDVSRIVFLGAGPLLAFAREAALKSLELSAGAVLSYCESPLGFRHGPKSLVNAQTDIILMASSNAHSKAYDNDLYLELVKDDSAFSVTRLNADFFNQSTEIDDVWAGLPYVVYCQVLAFYKSLALGLTPDNPFPSGEVNRVVQGVTIYPWLAA
ncbi:SIS domain-containing protein [Paraglaciecola sp.]|uniref:SIS domain-containing protein n=1 Tax=Paraglaciecola sp. TaxID=1920173 RepID=UPI0030F486F7